MTDSTNTSPDALGPERIGRFAPFHSARVLDLLMVGLADRLALFGTAMVSRRVPARLAG
jgi:hypothetical protein